MSIQCAARFTMVLDMPDKTKPFIIFQCEKDAHEGDDHYTTGKGPEDQEWKMSWIDKPVKKKPKEISCSQN